MNKKHTHLHIGILVAILFTAVLIFSGCKKDSLNCDTCDTDTCDTCDVNTCDTCDFNTCAIAYSKRYWLYDVKDDPGSAAMWVDLEFLDNDYISASTQSGTKKVQLYSSNDSVRVYRVSNDPFAVHIYINVFNMEVVYSWSEKGPGVFNPTVYTKDYFGILSCEE